MLSSVRVRELGSAQQWPLASRQMRSTAAASLAVRLRKPVALPSPPTALDGGPAAADIPKPSSAAVSQIRCLNTVSHRMTSSTG